MNIVWNREIRKRMAVFGLIFLIGILAANLCVVIYSNHARMEYNKFFSSLFGNVIKAYPEITEEELVQVLCGSGNENFGKELLARYGVYEEYGSNTFAVQEHQIFLLKIYSNITLILLLLICGAFLYFYLWKRQKRIFALTYYMERLNRHDYRLNIEDNMEDELSGLRNEVYKFIVLLREQADRAVEQKHALANSVADISHQLKTPLTSIMVLVDDLSENPDMDKTMRQRFMAEIMHQLTGMSWLITTMLKLSKLDAGVVELQRVSLDMKDLVDGVLSRLEIAAEWKQISFSVNIPEYAGLVADKRWTAEALLNIVKNAIEHSPDGSCVEISGEENQVYARITVRDHGEGITKEEQQSLFQRFYNGSNAREDSIGIGLALAKEIVEKQGGYISVESRKGEGTLFAVKFLKQ